MLELSVTQTAPGESVLALPVIAEEGQPRLVAAACLGEADLGTVEAFLNEAEHSGKAGTVQVLPRPGQLPCRLLLFGVGDGSPADWRAAGAALARTGAKDEALAVVVAAVPAGSDQSGSDIVNAVAEGLLLASYRYRIAAEDPDRAVRLTRVALVCEPQSPDLDPTSEAPTSETFERAVDRARAVAEATCLARDLTNTPSNVKTPQWFADRIVEEAAGRAGVTVEVFDAARLAEESFGAVLAVGAGSTNEPRLVTVRWQPETPVASVVLVGKGITFDTGGICLKPADSMRLMRKDMGGGAAVAATVLGAAALGLPVALTALVPLAENSVSGAAFRPGDVLRHRGGLTSEVINTDAEGRLVLADALAYAAETMQADAVVDLATLTGAQHVALGKRTAALFSTSDALAAALADAAGQVGESLWRLPLVDEYAEHLRSDVADLVNSSDGPGSVMAALYLREFTGAFRDRWAHLDMSSCAWSDSASAELSKGATGWGVRTLLRWLSGLG